MNEKGEVVVTLDEHGECVLVSRQNEEHEMLSIIWEKSGATESTIPAPLHSGQFSCSPSGGAGIVGDRDHFGLCPRCQVADNAQGAPHTPERDFTVGEDGYFNFHTPEQAHGDALADAISICEGVPAQDAYIAGKKRAVWGRWVDADALLPLLRQALTASGVPELKKERLWGICMAYEKGVCVGADGTDLPDPYPEGSNDSHAYQYGLQVGRENRENRIAAAPTDGRGP